MRRALLAGAALGAACAAHDPVAAPSRSQGDPASGEPRRVRLSAHAAAAAEPAAAEPDAERYFGAGYPRGVLRAPGSGVGSLGYGTWIRPAARAGAMPLGSVRVGGSVALLGPELLPGDGTCPGFVRVERGFVCTGRRATLDMQSRWLQAGLWTEPAPGALPYQYALSVGAPRLTRPLPRDEMRWKLGAREQPRMEGWAEGHDELAELEPIAPNGPIPDFLREGQQAPQPHGEPKSVFLGMFPGGSMIAYTRAFEAYGETWVLSTDLSVIPARGLKRFRLSQFHGVELGSGLDVPMAWIRKRPRPKWMRSANGFELTGESWPAKSHVALTGREETSGKRRLLETRENGLFIDRGDATLVEAREKLPEEVKGAGKWIHVRVLRGTLTLYEGPRPVFTTLMSPGKTNGTPFGRYFIESKHHYSSMGDGKNGFWIADVPWTIYFKRPFAIHASYWHEDFGQRKSGGCVNLSPLDAKRVFDWVSPALPAGWDTVQAHGMGGGTFVLVEG